MGCVLIRDGRLLRDTFHTVREYTKDVEERSGEEVNFQDCGIQMTRGFKALKLWMSMKVFGLETFREAISQGIGLAELAEEVLRVLPHWEITTPATIGIVTFRYAPAGMTPEEIDDFNRCLVEEMMEDGFAMVSSTELKGRTVLRMCTNNPRTTEADIGGTIQRLDRFGRELSLRWRKRGMKKGVA